MSDRKWPEADLEGNTFGFKHPSDLEVDDILSCRKHVPTLDRAVAQAMMDEKQRYALTDDLDTLTGVELYRWVQMNRIMGRIHWNLGDIPEWLLALVDDDRVPHPVEAEHARVVADGMGHLLQPRWDEYERDLALVRRVQADGLDALNPESDEVLRAFLEERRRQSNLAGRILDRLAEEADR